MEISESEKTIILLLGWPELAEDVDPQTLFPTSEWEKLSTPTAKGIYNVSSVKNYNEWHNVFQMTFEVTTLS